VNVFEDFTGEKADTQPETYGGGSAPCSPTRLLTHKILPQAEHIIKQEEKQALKQGYLVV